MTIFLRYRCDEVSNQGEEAHLQSCGWKEGGSTSFRKQFVLFDESPQRLSI